MANIHSVFVDSKGFFGREAIGRHAYGELLFDVKFDVNGHQITNLDATLTGFHGNFPEIPNIEEAKKQLLSWL